MAASRDRADSGASRSRLVATGISVYRVRLFSCSRLFPCLMSLPNSLPDWALP